MGGIFISYRRSDGSGYAHALQAQLERRLGPDKLFIDVDSIKPGQDFVEEIEKALDSSSVLLVLIGKRWFQPERLQDPQDFVRLEIILALKKGKQIIPVLLEGSTMPKLEDLPDPLRPLTRRQAFEISDLRFNSDIDNLIDIVAHIGSEPGSRPTPPPSSSAGSKKAQPQIIINSHRRHAVALMPGVAFFFDGITSFLLFDSYGQGTTHRSEDFILSLGIGFSAFIIGWSLLAQSRRNYFSPDLAAVITGAQLGATAFLYPIGMVDSTALIWGIPLLIYLTLTWRWRKQPFKMNS